MVHSRYIANPASATDRDALRRDNAAGSAIGLYVVAARALAGAGTGSFAVAANPGDSDRRAAVVPVASCVRASCCRCDCYRDDHCSSFDHDPPADDVAVPVAVPPAGVATAVAGPVVSVRYAVAAVPSVAAVAALDATGPVADAHRAAVVPSAAAVTDAPGPAAADRCADAVVPNAVAAAPAPDEPGPAAADRCVDAAVPSVAAGLPGAAVAAVAAPPAFVAGLPAVPAGGYPDFVDVVAGADHAHPYSAGSARHRARVCPARWQDHSRPTVRPISSVIIPL